MRRASVLVAVLALIVAAGLLRTSEAASGDVILLHGFNDSASDWNTAKAQYEASGYTVHALSLPRNGSSAGDSLVNADYVQAYIASQGLTSVKLDGHSLGGWLALYLALVRGGDVSSIVLRDTGTGCWFGIPADQCPGSSLLAQINSAPSSSVPILNLNHSTAGITQVDCLKIFNLSHSEFLSNSAVTAAAIGWPGASHCAQTPTATPTATPTPTPCSWWDRLRGRC